MSWKGPLEETITCEWKEIQQKGGRLPAVRTGATSCLYEDNIYLFFGFGAGIGRSSDVWRFNLTDGLWNIVSTKGNNSDKPGKRDGHSTTDIGDGKVLIFGGQGDPGINEKSERTLDIVKTKTWEVRDLYNDLFQFDCKTDTFEMLCPEGGVPLCRRGHSAIYFPKNGYGETQVNVQHLHTPQAISNQSVGGGTSPKRKKGAIDEIIESYEPIPENSLIVFGGSGMEVSKYIEAVYNDIWVYNLDTARWSKTKCRGIEPKPLFDHRCVRIGHIMLVIGGITATNAKAPTTGSELSANRDVMILNLKTLVWSYVDVINDDGKSCKLNLHGHSLVLDPYEEGVVYLFGGKDTVDGKQAAMETVQGAKRWTRKSSDNYAWRIDVREAIMSPIPTMNNPPESRYEHLTQVHASEGVPVLRAPPPKRKAGIRDEPLFYLFGGARNDMQGLCDPVLHALVRRFTYTNPELMSVGGSKAASQAAASVAPADVDDNNTISTVHTADQSSIYTNNQQYATTQNEEDLKQPSIWEKRQQMELSSGKSTMMRTPSSWGELKLALSCSFTDKRSSHLAPGATTTPVTESPADTRPGTGQPAVTTSGAAENKSPTKESTTGLTAKQKQKREIMRLKALGSQVLPLVKGKAYKEAKETYFNKFPAPMPPLRTYETAMGKSRSVSRLVDASQSKMG